MYTPRQPGSKAPAGGGWRQSQDNLVESLQKVVRGHIATQLLAFSGVDGRGTTNTEFHSQLILLINRLGTITQLRLADLIIKLRLRQGSLPVLRTQMWRMASAALAIEPPRGNAR